MSTVSDPQPDLRHTLSGAVANNLIPNEEADPEAQPLRGNTPTANRERFQQNQRTAAQGVVQRSSWMILLVIFLVSILVFIWGVFYFRGWHVWREHNEKPCDQPLANWLLSMLLLPLIWMTVECFSCRRLRIFVIFFNLVVLLIGLRQFYQSKTCDTTNPELYSFVRHYLIFLTVWWTSLVVMPLVFVAVVIYGMWHGWFDELNGASPETIKNVETVAFDPTLFSEEGKQNDDKPAPECCICTETFEPSREIKRTTCKHYFHEDCLGKWLRVSTSCPLCRENLEKTTLGDAAPDRTGAQDVGWAGRWGLNLAPSLPDHAISSHEDDEVRSLLLIFPDLDETTALLAVRQSGSAEQAAAYLGAP